MHHESRSTAEVEEQQLLVALAETLTAGRRRLEGLLALVEDGGDDVVHVDVVDVPVQTSRTDAGDAAQLSHS